MRKVVAFVTAVSAAGAFTVVNAGVAGAAPPDGWDGTVAFKERVVSSPTKGGGYPGEEPAPGGCKKGNYDSNFSEAFIALKPDSERLVGGAKAFYDKWSTWKSSRTVSFVMSKKKDSTHVIGGYDCVSTGTQKMPPSWTNVTDPNFVWDRKGRVHQLILAYNAYWGSVEQPNGDIFGVYSDDNGKTWKQGNNNKPVEAGPELSVDSSFFLDKPWIAANQNPSSKWVNHVYGAWVLFTEDGAELHTGVTRNRGKTWTNVQNVKTPVPLGPKNPWPMIGVDKAGVVYVSFVTYGEAAKDSPTIPATLWVTKSTDDGRTWKGFKKVAETNVVATSTLPGTQQHRTIVQYQAVAPDRKGDLYVAWNEVSPKGDVDVKFTWSHDAGKTWSKPKKVNDDGGGTNQFSATVTAGEDGSVAVGFYDQRAACPTKGAAILPANRGKEATCIGLSLQAYRDNGTKVKKVGPNVLASKHLWDPYQPGQTRDGIKQLACEKPKADCDDIFIGDYFSMVISDMNVYTMSSSTYYPSTVKGDDGKPIFYQQQLLTTVSREELGID